MSDEVVRVGKNRVRYIRYGRGPVLLFLHGLGADPHFYDDVLIPLSREYTVIAPALYGMNYLAEPPETVEACVGVTKEFCKTLRLKVHGVVGHSTGGLVAMRLGHRKAVAVNPAFPVRYGSKGFLWRSIWKHVRALSGISGGMRGSKFAVTRLAPWNLNFLQKPAASKRIVRSLSEITHRPTSAAIIYGTGDEFFTLSSRVKARRLPGLPHDWIIFYPGLAVQEIEKALKR